MKKALVIGVILLFLGVGFQPALANEISTNIVSDIEEDCLDCQPINRVELLRIKLLLIRLEVFTNIVLSRFGHIPEIEESCQKISNRVTTFREMINELKHDLPWDENPIICTILASIIFPIWIVGGYFAILYEILEGKPILQIIPYIITDFLDDILFSLGYFFFEVYDCFDNYPWK